MVWCMCLQCRGCKIDILAITSVNLCLFRFLSKLHKLNLNWPVHILNIEHRENISSANQLLGAILQTLHVDHRMLDGWMHIFRDLRVTCWITFLITPLHVGELFMRAPPYQHQVYLIHSSLIQWLVWVFAWLHIAIGLHLTP